MNYDYKNIEKKWQNYWKKNKTFKAVDFDKTRPKFYANWEFPYPSAEGLHVGHPRGTIAIDVISRMKRHQNHNVLHCIGWDAFGLPSERYAIKTGEQPQDTTIRCAQNYKRQIENMGISYDWDREIYTTDPEYYKWTQWLFIQFFKHGLAYKKTADINFCTDCKIGLANEEVVDGSCERCGNQIEKRKSSQWMLKITEYADKLIEGLDLFEAPDFVKVRQKNWIGKSKGVEFDFDTNIKDVKFSVYTTRPDTIYGTTFVVIAPESKILDDIIGKVKNKTEVNDYIKESSKKSELERKQASKDKTGVELKGINAINPFTGKDIKVFVGDFVIAAYGTGIVMATPGHDERDFEFAKKYGVEIIKVIEGPNSEAIPYSGKEGKLINSGKYTGLSVEDAIVNIIDHMEKNGFGKSKTNYSLRDWVFSRQRYWGEPIPLVKCKECGWVPVDDSELPLRLPETDDYLPTDDGKSPLAKLSDWVDTECPRCKRPAKRETDIMPNWAGSSWYFLRYIDPNNKNKFADYDKLKYWLPLDIYDGGQEHVVLHVLYSRFWNNFLYDIGLSPVKEYFKRKTVHGYILGESGEKMSKSKGNVISPDQCIEDYGADAFRVYEMFLGAFSEKSEWSDKGIVGVKKFLDKVWKIQGFIGDGFDEDIEVELNNTIVKVTKDTQATKFNTAIASMMGFSNLVYDKETITKEQYNKFITLLSPYAPHMAEELNTIHKLTEGSMQFSKWPEPSGFIAKTVEIMVQENNKNLKTLYVDIDSKEEDVIDAIKDCPKIAHITENYIKVIYIKNRLINFIVRK